MNHNLGIVIKLELRAVHVSKVMFLGEGEIFSAAVHVHGDGKQYCAQRSTGTYNNELAL